MTCRHCGKEFADDAKYCPYCGAAIKAKEHETINVAQNCWNCGEENLSDAIYCSNCGSKLKANKLLVKLGYALTKKQIIDVCPRCHSRNIMVYRNGYDYSPGFWGAIFGVKGAGYAGGFDANRARCRCMNCGKDWLTDYDYRLIK